MPDTPAAPVTSREALAVWTRVGFLSFGGPAGQIALMHRILVEEKRWVSEERFLHALNFCMLLPGPEAQQLAIYIGWLLHGYPGGLAAGTLFVLPGFVTIMTLSVLYAAYHQIALVGGLLFGLKAAVVAVVVDALVRIGRRVFKKAALVALSGVAFVAIFFFGAPFPLIVLGAALAGIAGSRFMPGSFAMPGPPDLVTGSGSAQGGLVDDLLDRQISRRSIPTIAGAARMTVTFLAIWFAPVAIFAALLGAGHVITQEGIFFSKMAVLTFGGAYAVLAWVAQEVVQRYGWLSPGQMVDGLGLAETTPGPLILVLQFVGFIAAYGHPGTLHPMLAGVLGALLTVWVTFVPCFLWIFLGAPWVETMRGSRRLSAALSAITAAVIGVILNLAVWFGLHVFFSQVDVMSLPGGVRLLAPVWSSLDVPALAISSGAFLALVSLRVGMLPVLTCGALAGAIWRSVSGG